MRIDGWTETSLQTPQRIESLPGSLGLSGVTSASVGDGGEDASTRLPNTYREDEAGTGGKRLIAIAIHPLGFFQKIQPP